MPPGFERATEACAAKLAVRRRSAATREIRRRWYALREQTIARIINGGQADLAEISVLTLELWAAEAAQAGAAARWRAVLAAREALPVAERWDLAKMERWAAAQPEV